MTTIKLGWVTCVLLLAGAWTAGCQDTIECKHCRDWKIARRTEKVGHKPNQETSICITHESEEGSDVRLGVQISGVGSAQACVDIVLWADTDLQCKEAEGQKQQIARFTFELPRQKQKADVEIPMRLDPGKNAMRAVAVPAETLGLMLQNNLVRVRYQLENGEERTATFALFGLRTALVTSCQQLKNCPEAIVRNL